MRLKYKEGDKVKYSKIVLFGDENEETIEELNEILGKEGVIIEVYDYDTKYPYDVEFSGFEDVYALSEKELEYV